MASKFEMFSGFTTVNALMRTSQAGGQQRIGCYSFDSASEPQAVTQDHSIVCCRSKGEYRSSNLSLKSQPSSLVFKPHTLFLLLRIFVRTHKMQRDIRLIADHPTIVPRRNIEDIARFHLDDAAIVHRSRSPPRNHQADMFHHATLRPRGLPHVQRPPPARLVSRASNPHSAHLDPLKLTLFKSPHLVRILKPLQDHLIHDSS